ncbi:GNAT family N-acetyltransferase [Halorussus halophilus]|uniref:GNAT family N-acetyltransferase n=1 Tax=Halorussus halophilus TaxID=2650975 RepID=UPI001CE3B8E6|nr:GNAT family N-acetyltransferase [Halorussus halophilus]
MCELAIRRATAADAKELTSVLHSAYRENRELGFPAKAESVTESEVAEWSQEARIYVAESDRELVGGVRLEETEPERVKLSRLGVHEDWKGEGVGSRLLSHAEEVVREEDYETIWLTTPESHPYLPELYRRRGYEETEPYPLEYREYDEVVMEKSFRD